MCFCEYICARSLGRESAIDHWDHKLSDASEDISKIINNKIFIMLLCVLNSTPRKLLFSCYVLWLGHGIYWTWVPAGTPSLSPSGSDQSGRAVHSTFYVYPDSAPLSVSPLAPPRFRPPPSLAWTTASASHLRSATLQSFLHIMAPLQSFLHTAAWMWNKPLLLHPTEIWGSFVTAAKPDLSRPTSNLLQFCRRTTLSV